MKQIEGGVTAAKGFFASSTAAGIKYQGRQDMAMVYSSVPCVVSGTFTTNMVKAAPVLWDKMISEEKGIAQVVVINAGIANAATTIRYAPAAHASLTIKDGEFAIFRPRKLLNLSIRPVCVALLKISSPSNVRSASP